MTFRFLSQATQVNKNKVLSLVVSLVLFFPFFANGQGNPLTPYSAEYTAFKWGDDIGNAKIELTQLSEFQYSLTYASKVSKFFLSDKRNEHSIFSVLNGEIIPNEYHYSRRGTGANKSLDVTFVDTDPATIVVKDGDNHPWNGQLDNQLYRLFIANSLALGNQTVAYDYINSRGQLRSQTVSVVGEETLKVPFGELTTIKVKINRKNSTRETFAWFAPSLNYTLVRLQQFKDGDEQGDIQLKHYTPH